MTKEASTHIPEDEARRHNMGPTTPTSINEVLKAAKALLATPNSWRQNVNAVDDQGRGCHPESDEAKQYCAFGALVRAGGPPHTATDIRLATGALVRAATGIQPADERIPERELFKWNDHDGRTHSDVIDALDKAITETNPKLEG